MSGPVKFSIDVVDFSEGTLIARGLERPDVRALVKIMGAMDGMPTEQAKAVLIEVQKRLDEK